MKSGEWGKKYDQEIDAITLKGDISVAVHINSYPISWIRLNARKMLRTAVASSKHAVASVWVVNQKWQMFLLHLTLFLFACLCTCRLVVCRLNNVNCSKNNLIEGRVVDWKSPETEGNIFLQMSMKYSIFDAVSLLHKKHLSYCSNGNLHYFLLNYINE